MLRGLQRGDKQGGRRKKQPPLSSRKKKSRILLVDYSLKTKARVWPAKRTSFTCPFSLISKES